MRFTLYYRGPLESGSNPGKGKHKHEVRLALMPQLTDLWRRPPFTDLRETSEKKGCLTYLGQRMLTLCECTGKKYDKNCSGVVKEMADSDNKLWRFTSIVSGLHYDLTADLDILFLRPEEPGIAKDGDIDNRLKILLDALCIPRKIPPDIEPPQEGAPIPCLLADDSLITGISVKTDRLLGENPDKHVLLIMRVKVSSAYMMMSNIELIGG